MTRKFIYLPGATNEYIKKFRNHLKAIKDDEDGDIISNHDIKIYDIDNVEVWSKQQIEEFLDSVGIQYIKTKEGEPIKD